MAPFCDAGECVACSALDDPDAACVGVDPDHPVCLEDECVACPDATTLCPAVSKVCECTACTAHDQCAADAGCALDTGECLPEELVFYVADLGVCPGSGTSEDPFCSVQAAVDAIGPGGVGTIRVAPHSGIGYPETVTIGNDMVVAILGEDASPTILLPDPAGGLGILQIDGAATSVYLERLRLRSSYDAPAISVLGARLHAARVELVQNAGGGLSASDGADVTLVNAMVGSAADFSTPVSIGLLSDVEIVYSTLIAGAAGYPVSCDSPGLVAIRNSILLGFLGAGDLDCGSAILTTSATEAEVGPFFGTEGWFTSFAAGDLHLSPTGEMVFAQLGQWHDGDPLTDIDGDLRPAVDGTQDYPGVDVPP